MKIKEIPANIGEYLKYDETSLTGLRWIKARQKINVGDPAGSLDNRNYYQTMFYGKHYKNHRIIFFLHHGYCPACIDHVDNVRTNNRIENLREATASQNQHNRKISKDNSSGHKGVFLKSGKYQYWEVRIWKNGKCVISKTFPLSQFQSACDFSDEQRQILHGDFSNNGGNTIMYFDNDYLISELKQIENDLILWQDTFDIHDNKEFVFLNIVNLLKRKSKLESFLKQLH